MENHVQKKLKKINVMNLRIDMHIHEFCTPWMNHPFWRENFLLQKQEDLRQIQESGIDEVWIDVLRGHDIDDGKSEEENKLAVDQVLQQAMSPSTVIAHVSITDELQTAMKICETARSAVISMFHEIRLGQAINAESAGELVESISASVRRNATALVSLARLKSIDDYNRAVFVDILVFVLGLAGAMAVSFALSGKIVGPLLNAIRTAKSVAGGNLTNRIETGGKDETGELLRALADMQANLRDLIGQIGANARQTVTSCSAMSSELKHITQSVHGQHDATSAVAAAIEEMNASINNIHVNADQALDANRESAELASEGVNVIQNASNEMLKISAIVKDAADVIERVGQQTDEISSIVNTIRDVADQTNLLALNAAIEAARAGEQGRGFTVVADEVRKLAEKTTSSSEEIRQMIEAVQLSSKNAVDNIHQIVNQMETAAGYAASARKAIEYIQRSSKQSEGHAKGISVALSEQSSASHLIAQQIEGITRMSDENAQSVARAGSAMHELEERSGSLSTTVENFKV
ncbi:hypothetical protein B9N43_03140 [Denitratisoma sp. DHT3]|nr:hypothetical protein B9N43_03140 [Denitratisoma sp. DHT3]